MNIKKWKLSCLLLLSNSVFAYNFGEVTPESFMQGMDQLFTGYNLNPDMETGYLTGLSHLSSGLVGHPDMRAVVKNFEHLKKTTQCEQYDKESLDNKINSQPYCAKILNGLSEEFLSDFGLDGLKNDHVAAGFFYIPPNDKMVLHNHLNSNAVIVIVKGQLRSLNFDIISLPNLSKVVIQKTKDMWLSEGEVSYFGVKKDNLHELHTINEGTIFLSIYTNSYSYILMLRTQKNLPCFRA
ncbi:hypothetical protein GZ77_05845 [Endozoicomonas montiporae]|uniref:Uncharacterized protein n=2 Tax=Endozoicomonas montiporae TaxID=1027273 RepID=A0A081NC25_9GAMM|nr:hypothetical protein [Endozoicomonas montiporae]AMO56320.1 hypothetical protein EZMO1_2217 [Endozoicomonas montiporae CL-33]KEQ15998.1 hypothetical protein GZ77_05845 [Endozoicomonas montiporae]